MNGEVTITVGNGTVRLGTTTRDGEAVLVLDKGQTLLDVACFLDAMGWRTVDVNSGDDLPPAPPHWAEVELRKCERVLDEHLTIKGGSVSERLLAFIRALPVPPIAGLPGSPDWFKEVYAARLEAGYPEGSMGVAGCIADLSRRLKEAEARAPAAVVVGPAPGTWPWACEQMIAGRKVRRKAWGNSNSRIGVGIGKGQLVEYDHIPGCPHDEEYTLPRESMTATDWTLYEGK